MTADDVNEHSEPTAVASYATEGEAEVAQAKLRAYGVEAFLDDQIEGGTIPVEGEAGSSSRFAARTQPMLERSSRKSPSPDPRRERADLRGESLSGRPTTGRATIGQ